MRGKALGQSDVDKILHMKMQDESIADIAKKLNYSTGTVYRALRNSGMGRYGGGQSKRASEIGPRAASKLDELVQVATPRAKAAERTETKQSELERLRQIVERLASRYPSILVKVL